MTSTTQRQRRKPPTARREGPVRAVFYLRVSTREQADSGAGLAAQETRLRDEAARRGWEVVAVFVDAGATGKTLNKRPGVTAALALVESGQADLLAVAKLDRLSRSVVDTGTVLQRAKTYGWALVALDLGVDTTTPAGRLVANVMASVAEWEREVIAERTKDALAEKRAQGVRLGRAPLLLDAGTVARILAERADGRSYHVIAGDLTDEKVPTPAGGATWHPGVVRTVYLRHSAVAA